MARAMDSVAGLGLAPLVAIHTHPAAPLGPSIYLVRELARVWAGRGIATVEVPAAVPVPSARVGLMHVDCSRVLPAYARTSEAYRATVNGRVGSIEKRAISRQLVRRGDGYDGPVIVKTNLNYGGIVDHALARRTHPVRTLAGAVRQRLPWAMRSCLAGKDYRVYERVKDVPRAVWWNPDLVVERLLCEREGDSYVLRSWIFVGDRGYVGVNYSTHPVVQATTITRRVFTHEVPAEIAAERRRLGFDLGKFDFTIVDGVPRLLDVNKTPTVGRASTWPQFARELENMARGIDAFL